MKRGTLFGTITSFETVINQDKITVEDQTPKRELYQINNEKEQQNQQKVSIPQFYNKQKTALELEQFNNTTNQENIENLLFCQSNFKTTNNSIPQDFNEESIFNQVSQNKQNLKNNEIQEPKSVIQVSQINQQQDLQKLNLHRSFSQNIILKQSATNKTAILQSEKFQNSYFQEFLQRCSQEFNLNKIDKRIISSIKKCHQL
ncbi:hypothetical protein ABPG73_005417 [Tetrahymena malaccensis]